MNNYLKYKPGWMQLLIFGSLTVGLFFAALFITGIIPYLFHISMAEFLSMDLSKPAVFSAAIAAQVIGTIVLFFMSGIIFAYLSDPKPLAYIGFKNPVPKSFYIIAIVIIVSAFPMVAWLSEINHNIHLPKEMHGVEKIIRDSEAQINDRINTFLKMKSPLDLIKMLFFLAILPAIAEEVFFRGVLQRLIILLTKRPWTGIIITGIIFSALHGQYLGFFPRLVLGVVLGALYWYSGSLWPGIIAHLINNAAQVILVYYNPQIEEKNANFSVLLITASTFLVIALTWWMNRISHTRFAEVYDTDDFHIGPRDQYIA